MIFGLTKNYVQIYGYIWIGYKSKPFLVMCCLYKQNSVHSFCYIDAACLKDLNHTISCHWPRLYYTKKSTQASSSPNDYTSFAIETRFITRLKWIKHSNIYLKLNARHRGISITKDVAIMNCSVLLNDIVYWMQYKLL